MAPEGVAAPDAGAQLGRAVKLAYGVGALSDSIKVFCFTTFLLWPHPSSGPRSWPSER